METPQLSREARAAQLAQEFTVGFQTYTGHEDLADISVMFLDDEQFRTFFYDMLALGETIEDQDERNVVGDLVQAAMITTMLADEQGTDFFTALDFYCLEWRLARLARPDEDFLTPEVLEELKKAVAEDSKDRQSRGVPN